MFVVNKSTRRAFIFEVCAIGASLLSPFIAFVTLPTHRATLPSLLPYVILAYRHSYGLHLFMLCFLAGFWCLFNFQCNLSGVTLDERDATVKADGRRARPMSKIKAVHIKMAQHALQGRQYTLRLFWDDEPVSSWQKAWTSAPANSSFLGSFRHEANAYQMAAIIAGFIGVPVQRETLLGIRPAPTYPGTRP